MTANGNRSLWDQPGRHIRPEDIAHLPPLRQQKIMDFSEGVDEEEGLSVVDLRFQEELLQAVNRSLGTPDQAAAVANYYYYMFGITEDMQIPPLHEIPRLIEEQAIDDPVFAERTCGVEHMKMLILADPRFRHALLRRRVPVLDPDTVASKPPRKAAQHSTEQDGLDDATASTRQELALAETCGECVHKGDACPLMALKAAIDRGEAYPLARSLEDAQALGADDVGAPPAGGSEEGAAQTGHNPWPVKRGDSVWVQGRYVHGVESKAMAVWEKALASAEADALAQGLVETGLEEGAVGNTSQVTGFETEKTLWYLRRLQYSMYAHALTAQEGEWCGGKQEIRALVAEQHKVDVHLHSFVPVAGSPANSSGGSSAPRRSRAEGDSGVEGGQDNHDAVRWEWKIDSLYPSSTLPTGSALLPPERPLGVLHLCLCGNHMWAAPSDSDLWAVNNIDLATANYDALTDQEYDELPQEEKDLVVHWDRLNDPVVRMYLEDELPANYTNPAYDKFEIDDTAGVLEKALKELLDDEDPYWYYMWNETFKAGLKWGDTSKIELDNATGDPVEWRDPERFDWEGYLEFRRQEDARTSLVYADGTSPPRQRQDVEESIRALEKVYRTKSQDLLVAEQAVAAGLNVSGQVRFLAPPPRASLLPSRPPHFSSLPPPPSPLHPPPSRSSTYLNRSRVPASTRLGGDTRG